MFGRRLSKREKKSLESLREAESILEKHTKKLKLSANGAVDLEPGDRQRLNVEMQVDARRLAAEQLMYAQSKAQMEMFQTSEEKSRYLLILIAIISALATLMSALSGWRQIYDLWCTVLAHI